MLDTLTGATDEALRAIEEEKKVRKTREVFLLFAMGSQFDHLIKQQIERLGVYCLVADPARVTAEDVRKIRPIGIVLSGGPASVDTEPPPFDATIFDLGIPVLGICLGFQMWAQHIGLRVEPADRREFGVHEAHLLRVSKLFDGCPERMAVLESHGDAVMADDAYHDFFATMATANAPVAAGEYKNLCGVQFHPEVTETEYGATMFENFCLTICGAKDRFPASQIAERKIAELRERIGDTKVLLALSGGSDSSTVAYLLKEAVGSRPGQIRGVYIKGVDRPDDEAYVKEYFGGTEWLSLAIVDETDAFLGAVHDKLSFRDKRIAMKDVYRSVLEREAKNFGATFIAQGTLYTDISESGGGYDTGARKATIKIHHNVNLGWECEELTPLADCVKDGGRNIGRAIGVPEELLVQHPFPGPGLLVRIEGEITREKLAMARALDGIYIEELRRWNLYETVWQAGADITSSVHTYTKGDDVGSGPVVMLWDVWSVNSFTARAAELPYDFLHHVTRRIGNEVRDVGAVTYRVSGKPFSTIEMG
ncbi:GMP synthase (glutamine-hydrolyzing) [Candidatus Wolfebacteria bacterium]|nr:GMP synthase (glutamine-hydrolyzing) [Candidatus Wolfebacteria bacterium]